MRRLTQFFEPVVAKSGCVLLSTAFFSTTYPVLAYPLHRSAPRFSPTSAPQTQSTEHDIRIVDAKGNHVTIGPLMKFSDMKNTKEWLSTGLRHLAYPTTTDIQSYTIPLLMEGHDLIGLAPTGSGKTVAFAVPALNKLERTPDGSPSVLVLAPTRELVQQTTRVFESLSGGAVRVAEAYGGTPREVQARKLHRGCDVLVACPGRLKDFLESGDVTLDNLSFIVFDEADRLLDMGFQIQLDDILSYINPSRKVQTMMWSATWPTAVQNLARNYLSSDRLTVRAGTAGTGLQVNEHIHQTVLFAHRPQERIEQIVGLIESGKIDDNADKLIIFVERQSDTESAAHALSSRLGIDSRYTGILHGGLSQRMRDRVMDQFKSNYIRLLFATDVASRGLDIPDVTCVINFQAPNNIDSYCHRIGRTGRAGRTGKAFTFVSPNDSGIAGDLCDYLEKCKMEVPPQLRSMAEENAQERRMRQNRFRGGQRDGGRRPPGRQFGGGFGNRGSRSSRGGERGSYGGQAQRSAETGW